MRIYSNIFLNCLYSQQRKVKKRGETFDVFILSHKFNAMMYEIFNFLIAVRLEGAANKFNL